MRPDEIIKTLERAGFEARYVGGCVRDTLLNRPIHDWDIASQALPEDVMHLFAHCVPTGLKHGTVTVLLDGVSAEVTTYRLDGAYHDGRHPDGESIQADQTKAPFLPPPARAHAKVWRRAARSGGSPPVSVRPVKSQAVRQSGTRAASAVHPPGSAFPGRRRSGSHGESNRPVLQTDR